MRITKKIFYFRRIHSTILIRKHIEMTSSHLQFQYFYWNRKCRCVVEWVRLIWKKGTSIKCPSGYQKLLKRMYLFSFSKLHAHSIFSPTHIFYAGHASLVLDHIPCERWKNEAAMTLKIWSELAKCHNTVTQTHFIKTCLCLMCFLLWKVFISVSTDKNV